MTIPLIGTASNLMPSIDGFSPYPIGVMVPFMKLQTAWMMYTGGYNWQFGKRTVDSMTNEEFNKRRDNYAIIQTEQRKLFEDFVTSFYAELSVIDTKQFQTTLNNEYIQIEKDKMHANVGLIKWALSEFGEFATNWLKDNSIIASALEPRPESERTSGTQTDPRNNRNNTTSSNNVQRSPYGGFSSLNEQAAALEKEANKSTLPPLQEYEKQRNVLLSNIRGILRQKRALTTNDSIVLESYRNKLKILILQYRTNSNPEAQAQAQTDYQKQIWK